VGQSNPSTSPTLEAPNPEETKRLRQVEESLSQLKKDIFDSKLALKGLQDAVLRGTLSGSKGLVDFSNQAEGLFRLQEAEFFLNDQLIYQVNTKTSATKLANKQRVFDDTLPPGEHRLKVRLSYLGTDKSLYSAISDFKNDRFSVEAEEVFTIDYGKTSAVLIKALDKGYFKSKFSERLYIDVQVVQDWSAQAPE